MPRLLRRPVFLLVVLGVLSIAALGCAAPAPAPAPPPPAAAVGAPLPHEASLLAQVNAQRWNAGAPPLVWCPSLGRAATDHSVDQGFRNTMTHVGLFGSDTRIRVERAGYLGWTNLGENIAAGYDSEAAVLTAWMNSAGHRANILNPVFTHMGSGYFSATNGTRYWTQDFGRNGSC